MNKVVLIGRLCNEPEVKTAQNGTLVARYRMAVNRPYKKEGQPDADFLNCIVFGKGAEFTQNYLRKGTKIAVEGHIQTGSYDKDGVRHYTTDIVVEQSEFCESKNASSDPYDQQERKAIQNETNGGFTVVGDDGDLPF